MIKSTKSKMKTFFKEKNIQMLREDDSKMFKSRLVFISGAHKQKAVSSYFLDFTFRMLSKTAFWWSDELLNFQSVRNSEVCEGAWPF